MRSIESSYSMRMGSDQDRDIENEWDKGISTDIYVAIQPDDYIASTPIIIWRDLPLWKYLFLGDFVVVAMEEHHGMAIVKHCPYHMCVPMSSA